MIEEYLESIEVTDRAAGENWTEQVSHISRRLKALDRGLNCPILALWQLSRTIEQGNPPIPVLCDLRKSGSIEHDVDQVWMLYCETVYNPNCDDPTETDVYARQIRNGATARASVQFDAERMTFQASAPDER